MKNVRLLLFAVAGGLSLGSCSSDDDSNTNPNADLVGTYKMTSWSAPGAVDFNGDGTANTNLMNETMCYNDSEMVVSNNGTYTMTYNYVNISATGTVSCDTETTAGTWTRNGNTITTTHLMGGQNMTADYSFSGGTNTTLTRNVTNWNYPTMNNGTAQYSQGNVTMVMTRE